MDVLLTPVKELEEEISFEEATDSDLSGGQSQHTNKKCFKSPSKLSIEPIIGENSSRRYRCTNPNCKTCHRRTIITLSDETNSNFIDAQDSMVESQRKEKSGAQGTRLSKSNSKQTDIVNLTNKAKGVAKKAMGSASSVAKNKKKTKVRTRPVVPANSELQAEARLQKGKQYEAKTSKTLKRIEAKYKSTGSANFPSVQLQSTPVIEDVYPTKDDNADELLKKVKVTTANLPFHIRSRSAPSKKRTPAKQPDAPKSSRGKKGIKEITDVEGNSKTPRTQIENDETEQQNEEIPSHEENASGGPAHLAQAASKDNAFDLNIESAIPLDEFDLEFDCNGEAIEQGLHEIDSVPPQIRQAALKEGVEEIILIDFPSNYDQSNQAVDGNRDNHESNASKSYDEDSGIENDASQWKTDQKLPSESQNHSTKVLDMNGNVAKTDCRLQIDLAITSESSTDHSLSSMSEKSASQSFNRQPQTRSHETSLSSSSSIQTSLQAMFDFEFNGDSKMNFGNCKVEEKRTDFPDNVVLEDVESLSDGDESDDEISSFHLIPSNEDYSANRFGFGLHEPADQSSLDEAFAKASPSCQFQNSYPSAQDSLESKSLRPPSSFTNLPSCTVEQIPQNMCSPMTDPPVRSKAWENDESGAAVVKETDEIIECQDVPFERYQQPRNEDVAAALDIQVGDNCLSFQELEESIPTVLTEQALMNHNLLHNKHLDVVRDTEPHYKDEDRAHMQSRLSSATATTDFSIVTDSTVTVDVDNSDFNGLKRGKELGHGAYGTVFEGLTVDGKLVAVKQVELTIANREIANKEYKRVQCEVNLLRTLQHKNIVRLLGTSFDGACVRIFMEHVPGGSLKSILTQYGALHERIFRKYTKQILEGLLYLHGSGVVHRDIKGSNVMLMTNGTIKLIDFGCAKRLRESALLRESTGSKDAKLLKTMLGTPYWMAPEVITSQGHGPKSDIWSVGATVYEMATTQPPLKNLEATAAMFHIGNGNEMPELPRREFSRSVINFVKKCFTRDQYQRPTASELLHDRFMTRQKVSKLTST